MTNLKDELLALETESALTILEKVTSTSTKVVFSTSFGKEDQAITHLIVSNHLPISIFTLDTGRLFEETYAVFDRTINKYKCDIQVFTPNNLLVENMVSEKGPYSFYDSVENRKECCGIRKLEPLRRALDGAEVWITGLRKEQSPNREQMTQVEWDEQNKIIKVHPLFNWSKKELDDYLNQHKVPVNALHLKGFPSIGCSSCTRAILPGEDERAGRWWWEDSKKECGLHQTK